MTQRAEPAPNTQTDARGLGFGDELDSIRGTLAHLIDKCHGDERPDCPILDDLAGATPPGDVRLV